MEQVKNALKTLEDAVVRLEQAVHAHKKNTVQANERIVELKGVIKTAYARLDKALLSFKKGDE